MMCRWGGMDRGLEDVVRSREVDEMVAGDRIKNKNRPSGDSK
jgi:hypothetical protein